MPRRPLPPRACAVAAVVAVVVAVPVGAASAAPLVPGGRWTTSVDLPDAWAGQADRLGVSVTELRQQENECTRPEVRAGDTTCGAEQGDLAGQVVATVAAGRWAGDECAVSTAARPLDLDGGTTRLSVVGPECLVVALDFPDGEDDDLAQSDSLGFTLSLVAGGPGGDVADGATPNGTTTGGTTTGGGTTGGTATNGTATGGAGADAPAPGTGGAVGTGAAAGSGGVAGRAGPAAAGGTRADGTGAGVGVTSAVGGSSRGGLVEDPGAIGSTTADLEVGADSTAEAGSTRSLLGAPIALGALLLGTTALLWLLFLVLRRRRGERA